MIYIAGDHLAVELSKSVDTWLTTAGIECQIVGATSEEDVLPLAEMIPRVAQPVQIGDAASGVLICGTGAGVEIGANRFKGVRAALCVDAEQAEWARVYDNANVLCLSSWKTESPDSILQAWTSNEFDRDPGRTRMIKDFDHFE